MAGLHGQIFTPYNPGTYLAWIMTGLHGHILYYIPQKHMGTLYGLITWTHSTLLNLNTYRDCCIAGPHGPTLQFITWIHMEHVALLGYMDTFCCISPIYLYSLLYGWVTWIYSTLHNPQIYGAPYMAT